MSETHTLFPILNSTQGQCLTCNRSVPTRKETDQQTATARQPIGNQTAIRPGPEEKNQNTNTETPSQE